jgi:hypothetical protein
MYHFDRRVKRKKKRYGFIKLIFKFTIFMAVVFGVWYYLTHQPSNVNNSGGILVPVKSDEPAKVHIAEPSFEMYLPIDWKEYARRPAPPLNVISWKGTSKESAARTIDVYVDTIPDTLAVNRILPVSGEEDRLAVSPASENCMTFSADTASLSPTATAKLKVLPVTWQGVQFLCDIPNSLRNVVGAGSLEGVNKVSLTGSKKGKHSYFIVYTDSSAHPDEKTFPDVLRSFRAI